MVDENNIILKASYVWTVLCLRSVDKIWIREMADEPGNFWSHPMLCFELCMGVPFEHESLEETSVKVEPLSPFYSKIVIVDLGP